MLAAAILEADKTGEWSSLVGEGECPLCGLENAYDCGCASGELVRWAHQNSAPVVSLRLVAPSLAGDAAARKAAPICSGLLQYFPNACAYVAHVSKVGNEQHNPGQPMQWVFNKSTDEADCIVRHQAEAGTVDTDGLLHSGKVAWRAFAQLERELLAADPTLKPGLRVTGFERQGGGK